MYRRRVSNDAPTPAHARTIWLIGVGCGDPEQITLEAVAALRAADYVVVTDKARAVGKQTDELALAREHILARHLDGPARLVRVQDPPRERAAERTATGQAYRAVVADWHQARAAAYEQALLDNPGDPAFLVWGDPAFYDSTIRVLEAVVARGRVAADLRVLPGISSLQLLAARHRIVLHEVGQPVHVTTGRRLREAIAQGQRNIVVMLNSGLDLTGLADWDIWWGANLGTPEEALIAGRVQDVLPRIEQARAATKQAAGWVMDVYLLRAPVTPSCPA